MKTSMPAVSIGSATKTGGLSTRAASRNRVRLSTITRARRSKPGSRAACWHASFEVRRLNPLLPVVAVFDDGAALAEWVAGAAEFASVAYEVDVEGVEFSGGDEAGHHTGRELVGALPRGEGHAAQHSGDVRVEREDVGAAGEEERAGDRLRADAAELRKIPRRLLRRHVAQEREVKRAVSLFDLSQEAAYDGGLLVGETAESNGVG